VPPTTTVEKRLAAIWSEVLAVPGVGLTDDFFDLGGHSLLATQVIARIADQLGVEISLRTLFARPTLGALAEAVTGAQAEPAWTS
jgi:acyl carrier protein